MITLQDANSIVSAHGRLQALRKNRRFVEQAGYVRVVICDIYDRNGQNALYQQASESQDARKVVSIILAGLDREIAAVERELRRLDAEVPE